MAEMRMAEQKLFYESQDLVSICGGHMMLAEMKMRRTERESKSTAELDNKVMDNWYLNTMTYTVAMHFGR